MKISLEDIQFDPNPIGSGQYGDIFKGICRGQFVAVKVLHFARQMSQQELDQFSTERDILRYKTNNIQSCTKQLTSM